MAYDFLTDRLVFMIAGDDAIPFLQGLITNDATKLAAGEPLYAALLSPQGKFLHDFFLIPHEGAILLDTNRERADDLLKRLNLYKLRSKVIITPQLGLSVMASWREQIETKDVTAITDPRMPALGTRLYGAREALEQIAISREHANYEAHRIALAVPDGAKDMQYDKSLLLEFEFESLNGVSFSKGCYVGQEVTARSKFRGQVRKSIYAVESDAPLPPAGTPVMSSSNTVGELKSVSGLRGIALLHNEQLEKSAVIITGNVTLHCHHPVWIKPAD